MKLKQQRKIKMKFIAENMEQVYKKNRERVVLNTIKALKKDIKKYARDGYKSRIIETYYGFNDEEQERITNYFVEKGFDVEWIYNDEVKIIWAKNQV